MYKCTCITGEPNTGIADLCSKSYSSLGGPNTNSSVPFPVSTCINRQHELPKVINYDDRFGWYLQGIVEAAPSFTAFGGSCAPGTKHA